MTDNLAPYLERLSSTQCDFLVWCIRRYTKDGRIRRNTLPFVPRKVTLGCLYLKLSDDEKNGVTMTGRRFVMNLISIIRGPSTLPY